MKNIRIANRYAKALFFLSTETELVEIVKVDMNNIAQTMSGARDLKNFLLSPIIKDNRKVNVIKEIFQNIINPFTLRFVNLIISKRRFGYIDYIAEEFLNLYRNYYNIKLAYFQTASPINDDFKTKLMGILKDYTKSDIELCEEIKKDLIGGFILKIGDKQYDTSIKTKLLKVTKEFSVNIYEKGL